MGIPSFTDKLVQEAIRLVLESIYEPVFLDCSHGFRPNRSCHTALQSLKKEFMGARWFIEGDIKGCFDAIDHDRLLTFLQRKVKDARLSQLIMRFLKAGYMENWTYHNTYSGTPQGGILSPILANIYLHELDTFVGNLKRKFSKPAAQRFTPAYQELHTHMNRYAWRVKHWEGEKREKALADLMETRALLVKTPCKSQTDKKIKYIRYADDFILSVNGSKQDCERIKAELQQFISRELKMELSAEKTLITHSNQYARFLGYDIRVRRSQKIKRGSTTNCKKRTLNGSVELNVPFDKIERFLFDQQVIKRLNDGTFRSRRRVNLLHLTDLEILSTYNAELRGICNYYALASNFSKLSYFAYLMEYSCLHTLASKHKCPMSKIRHKYRDKKGKWAIPYETKAGQKQMYFTYFRDCKANSSNDIIPKTTRMLSYSVTTLESRLKAKVCELYGRENAEGYEIHHINKLKNLKGKRLWERVMIAKKRKTIVLCHDCHVSVHAASK